MNERNVRITKRIHVDGSYASTYNVEILNSSNPELQLKETVSAIKNKLINLLPKVRGFKFVTFSDLKKKKKMMIKQNIPPFILTRN